MNKILKNTLILIASSILVWIGVLAFFTDKIEFSHNNDHMPEDTVFADGTYVGTGSGHNGDIIVEVTIENGIIIEVIVISHSETGGISDPAIIGIPAAIVSNNSTHVDFISGATVSSRGIRNAVLNALEKSAEAGKSISS